MINYCTQCGIALEDGHVCFEWAQVPLKVLTWEDHTELRKLAKRSLIAGIFLLFSICVGLGCHEASLTGPTRTLPTLDIPTVPIVFTQPDLMGNIGAYVEFPDQPVLVYGGDEERVYRREFQAIISRNVSLTEVSSFIGTDAGDRFEADFEIVTIPEGIHLYARNEHRRGEGYDAQAAQSVKYFCLNPCGLHFFLLGRVTDVNISEQNPNFGKLRARFHFGVRFKGSI